MPAEDYWESLVNVPLVLDSFGFGPSTGTVAEFGCGYGTFTLPLAARIGGSVYAVDIDPDMVARTTDRARAAGLSNVEAQTDDALRPRCGIRPGSCDASLLFNILHGNQAVSLLQAARDAVRPGGMIAVIHWRSDITTPRGPPPDLRPTPGQILGWATSAGGFDVGESPFLLPPWHFGLRIAKQSDPV